MSEIYFIHHLKKEIESRHIILNLFYFYPVRRHYLRTYRSDTQVLYAQPIDNILHSLSYYLVCKHAYHLLTEHK